MITYEFAVDGKSIPFQAADNNHAIVRLTATWQKYWRNLAQGSIVAGEHEAAVGISTGQTHRHNAVLYIEIAEKIEADANQDMQEVNA